MQFAIGSKINLHSSHTDRDTFYPLIYIQDLYGRRISSNSNMLYISKIFTFRYITNDKYDK